MSFDPSKYESQIRAILEAPGVDLGTVSAKQVRKQLQEQNAELTKEIVDEHKKELTATIHAVFEQVQAKENGDEQDEDENEDGDEDGEPEVDDSSDSGAAKRKRAVNDEGKPPKKGKAKRVSDADLARQLSKELNGRSARATSSAKRGRGGGKRGRKAKSAETVDSEGEGSQDAEVKPKRRGGFTKEYVLSEPLAALLGVEKLSRPQAVKQIWDHIKAKDLQAPEDRRDIVCDEKMKAIFRMDRINMFEMNKKLGEHLHLPEAA